MIKNIHVVADVRAQRVAAIPTPTPRLGSIPTSNRYEIPFTHYDELPPASGLVLFALRANRTRPDAGGMLIVMGKGNFVPIARRCASQSRGWLRDGRDPLRAHTCNKRSVLSLARSSTNNDV